MSDKPLSLDQIRPVLYTLHWAADLYAAQQGEPTLEHQDSQWLLALAQVAQALDPDATPQQRIHAKHALRRRVKDLEQVWRRRAGCTCGEAYDTRAEGAPKCFYCKPESPMTTKTPNQGERL